MYPAVLLMYFISAAIILLASLALIVQVSLPYNKTGRSSVLYSFILVFLKIFYHSSSSHPPPPPPPFSSSSSPIDATTLGGFWPAFLPLEYLIKKLNISTKRMTLILINVRSCNELLRMLRVCTRNYLKSVLSYKYLILDTCHLDTLLLEQGCED